MTKLNERELKKFLDESTQVFLSYFLGTPVEGISSMRERLRVMIAHRIKPDLKWIGLK